MPIDDEAEETLTALLPHFEDLTKEDLSKRMISQELKQLKGIEKGDLNMSSDSRGSRDNDRGGRRDSGDRGERREFDSNRNRYFINLGKNDGLSNVDLLEFLSEVSGAKKYHINDIALQDKRSFFNLDESQVKGFEDKFEGLELESGHAIRVNQETGGSSSGGRSRGGRSNFGGDGGGPGRRPSGAGVGRRPSGGGRSGARSGGGSSSGHRGGSSSSGGARGRRR